MWIVRLCVFVALLGGAAWAIDAGADRFDRNGELARSISSRVGQLPQGNDVVFLGDSRTHQGLDPRVFTAEVQRRTGRTVRAINLGRPGMQAPFHYFALKNYLAVADRKPDTIIVNFSYYLLQGRYWMRQMYEGGFVLTPSQAWQLAAAGVVDWPVAARWYVSAKTGFDVSRAAFQDHFMRELVADPQNMVVQLDGHMFTEETIYSPQYRGYLPRGDAAIADDDRAEGSGIAIAPQDEAILSFFDRFLALAADEGIRVIIYEFPWPQTNDTAGDRAIIDHYRALLTARAAGHRGVSFADYRPFLPNRNFVDPLHVNNTGSHVLTGLAAGWYLAQPAVPDG